MEAPIEGDGPTLLDIAAMVKDATTRASKGLAMELTAKRALVGLINALDMWRNGEFAANDDQLASALARATREGGQENVGFVAVLDNLVDAADGAPFGELTPGLQRVILERRDELDDELDLE